MGQKDVYQEYFFADNPVFLHGEEGYAAFRIPCIVKSPNGDLLAFCEGRRHSIRDYGDIDIVMKRSYDDGVTWTHLNIIASNGQYLAGNPSVVVDTTDPNYPFGRIFLCYCCDGGYAEHSAIKRGRGVREIAVITSADNGFTWSEPVNITSQIHKPKQPWINPEYTCEEDWRWYAIGPCHAIQLQHEPYRGRLLFPCNHSGPEDNTCSHTFYSDDHGTTWKLGSDVYPNTNECTVAELANGNVMINMRNFNTGVQDTPGHHRVVAISQDGGETWEQAYYDSALPEPICQGSLLRLTTEKGYDKNRLLFCNPHSYTQRRNLTVKLSYDEGKIWPVQKLIRSDGTAYSDLVMQSDGLIGVLYEHNNLHRFPSLGSGIYYCRFNLKWLTDGKDGLEEY